MNLFHVLLIFFFVGDRSKKDLENDAKKKLNASQTILKMYTSTNLTEIEIQRVLDSIADNEAYLSFNVLPVERAIKILKETFNPRQPDEHYSLELKMKLRKSFMSFGGFSSRYMNNSACLSHDHATQYTFVLQSLLLWREIMWHLPKLWQYAESDLLGEQVRTYEYLHVTFFVLLSFFTLCDMPAEFVLHFYDTVPVYLSLTHRHTHTHTHTLSLSLSYTHTHAFTHSLSLPPSVSSS